MSDDHDIDGIRARIKQLAERAARAALEAERRAPPPPPPLAHWSEVDRGEDEPTRLELEAGDATSRENRCVKLRRLLADGEWHSALELHDTAGMRFGGRLHELRRGLDGLPALDVIGEARAHAGRTVWWYRLAPAARAKEGDGRGRDGRDDGRGARDGRTNSTARTNRPARAGSLAHATTVADGEGKVPGPAAR